MKYAALLTTLTVCLFMLGCDVQSGITQKSLEKYQPTPTPEKVVIVEEPIDPADVIAADVTADGPQLSITLNTDKHKLNCDKYNRVMINGDGHKVDIKGACSQIMVNGTGNHVTAVASTEFITNGYDNTVEYSKYVNGKNPIVTDNSKGRNTITKALAPGAK